MTASLSFDAYGDAIGSAATVLRNNANRAGPNAAVPTCPGWTVRDLVAHQGMVHRWAAATLRGQRVAADALEQVGLTVTDQLGWFDDGVTELLQALVDTPADAEVWFFLPTGDAPRLGWARRQAHETSIHAIDAMSAALGRVPQPEETWLKPAVAVDGIDEMLTGFLARNDEFLASYSLSVSATDAGSFWSVGDGEEQELVADAVPLYLGMWNRGAPPSSPEFATAWQAQAAITWG